MRSASSASPAPFRWSSRFASKTVLYNTMVGAFANTNKLSEARSKAIEVLKVLDLYDKRDVVSKSLTLPERKRLELARALATEPQLLLPR